VQRDMDLVRQILLAIEKHSGERLPNQPTITGWDASAVNYHLRLLQQDNLIDATVYKGDNNNHFAAIGLTWKGHEFLDAARDDTVWNKAKAEVGEKVSSVPLTLLMEVLMRVARGMLGI
jgi:hypothetical protein